MQLNRWLGLTQDTLATYVVKEVHLQPGRIVGSYRYANTLLYDIPNNSAVVLEIVPSSETDHPALGHDANARNVFVVPAFDQSVMTVNEFLTASPKERAEKVLQTGYWVFKTE